VHVSGGQISLPLNGAPSTHILKPAIERFEGVVFTKLCCMHLARTVGMNTAHIEIGKVEGIDYLLVQRYDRALNPEPPEGPGRLRTRTPGRFLQALGIVRSTSIKMKAALHQAVFRAGPCGRLPPRTSICSRCSTRSFSIG